MLTTLATPSASRLMRLCGRNGVVSASSLNFVDKLAISLFDALKKMTMRVAAGSKALALPEAGTFGLSGLS